MNYKWKKKENMKEKYKDKKKKKNKGKLVCKEIRGIKNIIK